MELRWERAVELVRARGSTAQLCVVLGGEVVLDRAFGCEPNTLFWTFSASKPFVALATHLLAQRGQLDLDRPVAEHWPEFAQRGKGAITVRHVLQHRAGVPVGRGILADGLLMNDWRASIINIERARPLSAPGAVPAYHILSFGFILGELVRRVSGAPVREYLATELFVPLDLRDTYLGLPAALLPRTVPIHADGRSGRLKELIFNRSTTRRAVIPAAGISTTARDLARFYHCLLEPGVTRVFEAATLARARTPSSDGEIDRVLRAPVRWSQGFQLGGPSPGASAPRAMGALSSVETFGHNGSKCCIGWADPTRDLAVAYLTDQLPARRGAIHQAAVADAIIEACR
jgi:CubicO group peptidase (beta-lactamase class C family)